MPYEIRARDGEFCVMKQGTDESMGCHPTREKAMAQMRALYANEAMPMKAEGTIGGTPISELPPSSFAYCEPGDGAVSVRCHFPIRDRNGKADAAHVRAALSRLSQSPFEAKARAKIEAAARELGIGEPAAKASAELKAEPLTVPELDLWLAGKRSRRILMLPYGGPIPSKASPLGVDIDGEWFDDATDFFDGHKALLDTRARLTDWHHGNDPTGVMKGAIIGTSFFDDQAETVALDNIEYTGRWADYWANAGERRRELVAALERGNVPLYASSQAAYKRKAESGHIDAWPVIRNTISTSPQNTFAVVPPLKAILGADIDDVPAEALKALLVGLDAPTTELLIGSAAAAVNASALPGQAAVKAGRVLSKQTIADLERVLDLAERELPALIRAIVARGQPSIGNEDA